MSYIVEDNLNFFSIMLHQEEEKDDTVKVCYISGKPLLEDAIHLDCKHSFNYDPLFNDIYEHKKKSNMNETNRVDIKSIRCPYCRQVQNMLLPPNPSKPPVFGVNYYSNELDYSSLNKNLQEIPKCDYVGKSGKICTLRLGKQNQDGFYCLTHLIKLRRVKIIDMENKYVRFLKEQNDKLKQNVLLLKSTFCVEIIKRGPRKGEKCNKRTKTSFSCCDKHLPK